VSKGRSSWPQVRFIVTVLDAMSRSWEEARKLLAQGRETTLAQLAHENAENAALSAVRHV
jgi:hypothetical protein